MLETAYGTEVTAIQTLCSNGHTVITTIIPTITNIILRVPSAGYVRFRVYGAGCLEFGAQDVGFGVAKMF